MSFRGPLGGGGEACSLLWVGSAVESRGGGPRRYGVRKVCHLEGGFAAWKKTDAPIAAREKPARKT